LAHHPVEGGAGRRIFPKEFEEGVAVRRLKRSRAGADAMF
jgi:hypothetical protein